MKKWAKKLVSLALAGAMLTAPAAAVTPEGENETLFDSVWSLIDLFGLKAENDLRPSAGPGPGALPSRRPIAR